MKKKSKIVIALILALGLFTNISDNTGTNASHSANSTHSFTTSEDEGPIVGNHWKVIEVEKRLRAIILFLSEWKCCKFQNDITKFIIGTTCFIIYNFRKCCWLIYHKRVQVNM